MNIKYKFLMWFYKGNTQKEIDIILKYDPLNLLGQIKNPIYLGFFLVQKYEMIELSVGSGKAAEIDPHNRLLTRLNFFLIG